MQMMLLGGCLVQVDGKSVTEAFRTQKERVLLAYLAQKAEHLHHRENLAELFWPGRPAGNARANLRQAMLGVRRVFETSENLTPQEVFLCEEDTIQLNPNFGLWLDTHEFTAHIQEVRKHSHENPNRCKNCVQELHSAFDLYKGHFLEGINFSRTPELEDWVEIQKDHFQRQLLFTLDKLVSHYEGLGDLTAARGYARRLVNEDPLDERGQRHLIRLLALSGMRCQALEQYAFVQELIKEELDVEPSAETQQLYQMIKNGSPLPPAAIQFVPAKSSRNHNLPTLLTSFVGQESKLERLGQCIHTPACRLITVVGMAGIGKTRLALETASKQVGNFPDGIWFVPLDTVVDLEVLPQKIAEAANLAEKYAGISWDVLDELLSDKNILFVLDSFEHLRDETEYLIDILKKAPGVKFIITSRVLLQYQAACVFHVPPLTFPPSSNAADPLSYSAVRLFFTRSQRKPGSLIFSEEHIPEVIEICQRVAGLPLGIELAAASLHSYTHLGLIQGLRVGLDVLKSNLKDLPPRHRSMHVALESSWDLLNPGEQCLLGKLPALPEIFSLEEINELTDNSLERITRLVNHSLLEVISMGHYQLHPLVRTFLQEKSLISVKALR